MPGQGEQDELWNGSPCPSVSEYHGIPDLTLPTLPYLRCDNGRWVEATTSTLPLGSQVILLPPRLAG